MSSPRSPLATVKPHDDCPMVRLLLSVDEAAEALAMSRASMYRLIRRGAIPIVKIGAMTRVEAVRLAAYVEALSVENAAAEPTRDVGSRTGTGVNSTADIVQQRRGRLVRQRRAL